MPYTVTIAGRQPVSLKARTPAQAIGKAIGSGYAARRDATGLAYRILLPNGLMLSGVWPHPPTQDIA